MEKFYLSQALLKMAGGGMHPSHPSLGPLLSGFDSTGLGF